jgi:DNA-binding beta-propeller fold protein YncE
MGLRAPGAVVAGYRIESVVGRGGMGVVYRARELELERVVALKVIAPELLEDASMRERFLKEARTAASIEHPNVIPVHAAGERDGVAYLAMRFIEGDDARTLVRREGPLAPGRAADIAAQAGAGLDAIHRAGYVHRDVKPANVLVDRDGHVYVTDFGLAKQALSTGGATRTGQWVGTLDYVAPEQIRGGRVDARADVYALGGVLFFLLTGRVPFERDGDEAKLWAQLSEPAPVPSRVRAGLPKELDAVVARAMAKAPDERPPSAGDLGRAARAAAAGTAPTHTERMVARGAAAPGGAPPEPGLAPEASTVTSNRPAAATPRPRRRRGRIVAAVVAALAAAAVVLALTTSHDGNAAHGGSPRVRVVQTIPHIGHRPNGIAIAGGDLWVTSLDQPTITRIDAVSGRQRAQHPVVGAGASDVASTGAIVWVAANPAPRVVGLDARTGRVVRRLDLRAPPAGLAVGLGSLWVATSGAPGENALVRYDETGRFLRRTPLPHSVYAVAAGSGAVWVAEHDVPQVLRVDPATGKTKVWTRLLAPASALSSSGGYIWATMSGAGLITRISPRPCGCPTTAVGHRPVQALVAGGRLFVSSNTDHTVVVMDPRTLTVEGQPLRVGVNPYALAADERNVWVTGTGENDITRIAYR